MSRSIVVAFCMPAAGMVAGPEGSYLARARALCMRSEALGGRLVAWSANLCAMGWDIGQIEKAVLLAASIREEALSSERAWASGMAEGELEALSPDGQGILAWGAALVSAVALAAIAKPGEVLVEGELGALRDGRLTVFDSGEGAEGVRDVRGFRLDLEHPWKRGQAVEDKARFEKPRAMPVLVASSAATSDSVAEQRHAHPEVAAKAASKPCQVSLRSAMALAEAAHLEEALLEALDALARAREAGDAKAIKACMALHARLYASAGYPNEAMSLRESALEG